MSLLTLFLICLSTFVMTHLNIFTTALKLSLTFVTSFLKKFFDCLFLFSLSYFYFLVTSDFLLKFGHFCIIFWGTGSYLNLCLSRLSLREFCRRGRHCLFFLSNAGAIPVYPLSWWLMGRARRPGFVQTSSRNCLAEKSWNISLLFPTCPALALGGGSLLLLMGGKNLDSSLGLLWHHSSEESEESLPSVRWGWKSRLPRSSPLTLQGMGTH